MSDRIEKQFALASAEHRAALITFIMGYDRDAAMTSALLEEMPKAGADIIEIGIPFSDPMADGPVIQAAGKRALAAGGNLKGILQIVQNFRGTNDATPIILMGYYNPIYRYSISAFCKDAAIAGVDGMILVDLPPEEEQEVRPFLDEHGLKLIRLIAPTSDEGRLPSLVNSASGFIYYISVTGITGAKTAAASELSQKIARLREFTTLPIAAGFGIKTLKQVQDAAASADAVVVGSALVDIISEQHDTQAAVKAACEFIRDLAKGLKK